MTPEEKQLLVKDLSARLPYGVKVAHIGLSDNVPKVWDLIGLPAAHLADIIVYRKYRLAAADIEENIRPYLRPMSSMTEEEKISYHKTQWEYQAEYCDPEYFDGLESYDWLNAHHFDYRGLIEKGLALEAPDEMYKIE